MRNENNFGFVNKVAEKKGVRRKMRPYATYQLHQIFEQGRDELKRRERTRLVLKGTSDAHSLHRVQRSIDTLFELHKEKRRKGDVK